MKERQPTLFKLTDLGGEPFVDTIRDLNPWWKGKPGPSIPSFLRRPFDTILSSLRRGMTPAVLLRGPRRVGKTVLLRQLIDKLLSEGIPARRILYLPFDDIKSLTRINEPVLTIARWFEQSILGETFNEAGRRSEQTYLFLDEIQNLETWAPQLKNLVDNHMVRVLVTGSSSLRIEAGRDSLAGRVTTLDLGPLVLGEISELRYGAPSKPFWSDSATVEIGRAEFWKDAAAFGRSRKSDRDRAFQAFSERGGYPKAQEAQQADWPEIAAHLNETVIRRAIKHDLRMGPRGQRRDESLLEEVFRLSCRYAGQAPGQSVFISEIQRSLNANIGWQRILRYLEFLDGTLLIKLIKPLEIRLKKKRSSDKICLCDHGVRAAWLQESVPLEPEALSRVPHLADLAGRLAESTLGYYLSSIPSLALAHFPERGPEPEVDFVVTVGAKRIPIEVKYRRRIDSHEDTRGLRAFLEKTVYNAPFGLLVTQFDDVEIPDPRIIPISLASLLWLR